jgi:hypothetical protein
MYWLTSKPLSRVAWHQRARPGFTAGDAGNGRQSAYRLLTQQTPKLRPEFCSMNMLDG